MLTILTIICILAQKKKDIHALSSTEEQPLLLALEFDFAWFAVGEGQNEV